MIFRWFERLIDPFRDTPDEMAPQSIIAFYWHFLRQVRGVFAAILVVGFVVAIIEVALFAFLGRVIDLVQAAPSTDFFAAHGPELLLMAAVVLLLRPLMQTLHGLLINQAVMPHLTNLVRWQNHRYVLNQSVGFFHADFAGRIANRVMQTGTALRESAVQTVDMLWYVCIYAGSALFLFARADLRLALPLVLWVVGYIALLFYFVPRVQRRSHATSTARSHLMGRVVDGYSNIQTLKLLAHARREEEYARAAMEEQTRTMSHMARLITTMEMVVTSFNGLLIASTTALALWLWHAGSISGGAIALAVGLVIRLNSMSTWIMWVVSGIFENIGTVQDGMATIARVRAVQDHPDATELQVPEGGIRIERLGFHYGKSGGVIDDLDLTIAPGEKIGLVGPSGAGKSTLANLLLRLYDLESGRILIDGQDIARVTQQSLRKHIGVVSQDTSLLHRSIRENILYGRPDASEAQLMDALRKARVDEFIDDLQDSAGRRGLDAQVGERGVQLSGGQRQRIAIARVLLKDAPILILDEATSALDSETEAVIQASLDILMADKTVIAIAHRLSTIARMDRLVVLDRGRIVESGSHAQLIAHGGLYARLWKRQTGGFVAVDDAPDD